jgi:CHAT domain-containing protein/SIR2-like protein
LSDGPILDSELHVLGRTQAIFRVAGREYPGQPALDETLEERLRTLLDDPRAYGIELFHALLPPESNLLAGYRDALAIATFQDRTLRFRLFLDQNVAAGLNELRWERLYDARKEIPLARSRGVLLSRYLGIADHSGSPVGGIPKLLIVISNPDDLSSLGLPPIDVAKAREALTEALAPLAGKVSWVFLDGPATPASLRDHLVGGSFHALHLLAHGIRPEGGEGPAHLVLEKANANGDGSMAEFVDETLLSEIFEGDHNLRLVVLLACHGGAPSTDDPFSGLASRIVKRGLPAVVALRQAVSLQTAKSFSQLFYANLARSGSVERAVNEARQQLYLLQQDSDDWANPILFQRLQDGLLWEPEPQPVVVIAHPIGAGIPWNALLTSIEKDNFVPFLGPEITRGLLLSRNEIANLWVARYQGFPLDERTDLPAVAQFVETKEGRGIPQEYLLSLLTQDLIEREQVQERAPMKSMSLSQVIARIAERHFDRDRDEPHRILASLPISTYITTNYDSFLYEALRWKSRNPRREICSWREPMHDLPAQYKDLVGQPDHPLVLHLYGHDENTSSMVLTEDQHLDFLRAVSAEPERLPYKLRQKLTQSMLLFVGYDVRRLDCRVLLRGVIASLRTLYAERDRIAILQIDPETDPSRAQELKVYVQECCRGLEIKVFEGKSREFLKALRDRWEERHVTR